MKKKSTEHQRTVDAVKARVSPAVPCVRADADGYCKDGGFICCKCEGYKPVTAVAVATQEIVLERPQGATAADRIKHDIYMSRKHSAYSLAYFARAGWQLLQEKFKIGYGGWGNWCKENLGFSHDTAERYIKFYNSTVGKWRAAQGLADTMVAELTDKMLEAATAGLEYETGTQAMITLGIIKRNPDHGGKRAGAGRKPKDVAAELKAVTEHEAVLWASAKGALDTLVQLDSDRDFMRRLSDDHLADAARLLADLSTKAATLLAGRMGE